MSKINQLMHWNRPAFVPVTRYDFDNYFLGFQEEMNRMLNRFINGMDAQFTDWDQKTPSVLAVDLIENDQGPDDECDGNRKLNDHQNFPRDRCTGPGIELTFQHADGFECRQVEGGITPG